MSEFVKQINMNDALTADNICTYEYAILNTVSSLELVAVKDMPVSGASDSACVSIEQTELLEARFFSKDSELHIFRDNEDTLKAVQINDAALEDDYLIHDVRYKTLQGKTLIVREYLKEDEDGQMYVALTRAAGIE